MFTGIIEAKSEVMYIKNNILSIKRPKSFVDLFVNQSLSVNGSCLSINTFDYDKIQFEVMPETFDKTNLIYSKIVNLERALSVNGRLEGHLVLGHVDDKIKFIDKIYQDVGMKYFFCLPKKYQKYIVYKGSVSLNGVSLTVSSIEKDVLEISLISETLKKTNLGDLYIGSFVNLEVDYFAKIFVKNNF